MKSNYLTLLAGLSLLVPAVFWVLFARDGTSAFYPFPAVVFIPALFGLKQAAVAVPVVLFFLWNPALFHGDAAVPKRSYVLLIVTTLVSAFWFAVGWADGLAAQGAGYNYSVCTINIACLALLWTIFGCSRRDAVPSFKMNLLFHWMFFAWLAWYAFPFFGEIT